MKTPNKILATRQNIEASTTRLEVLERDIREGLQEYDRHELSAYGIAVGVIRNVTAIRSGGEWKKREANWENYCNQYLERSAEHFRHMERFIKQRASISAKTQKLLGSAVNNAQAVKAISEVPKHEQEAVAKAARDSGKKVTAKAITVQAAKLSEAPKIQRAIELDKTGNEIPDSILEDWHRAEETAKDLMEKASAVKRAVETGVNDADIIFRELSVTDISTAKSVYALLKQIKPHSVCTTCQGHERKKCKLCKGRGFLSEWFYSRVVPKEVREMREKK